MLLLVSFYESFIFVLLYFLQLLLVLLINCLNCLSASYFYYNLLLNYGMCVHCCTLYFLYSNNCFNPCLEEETHSVDSLCYANAALVMLLLRPLLINKLPFEKEKKHITKKRGKDNRVNHGYASSNNKTKKNKFRILS